VLEARSKDSPDTLEEGTCKRYLIVASIDEKPHVSGSVWVRANRDHPVEGDDTVSKGTLDNEAVLCDAYAQPIPAANDHAGSERSVWSLGPRSGACRAKRNWVKRWRIRG
jgi:hypothetical protein